MDINYEVNRRAPKTRANEAKQNKQDKQVKTPKLKSHEFPHQPR